MVAPQSCYVDFELFFIGGVKTCFKAVFCSITSCPFLFLSATVSFLTLFFFFKARYEKKDHTCT